MKHALPQGDVRMDLLKLPHTLGHTDGDHHRFYISSCESGAGTDAPNSNVSSQRSSISSTSSLNVGLPTPVPPAHSNVFLNVLKRLHSVTLRRKKHGRYRSLASSLHLFFKNTRPSLTDDHRSTNDFCKSPSSPQFPTIALDPDTTNPSSRTSHSCQQLYSTGADGVVNCNSKNADFPVRRSLFRRVRTSNKTVSEDNNTNTLSSLDLAVTPHLLPTMTITESTSSVTPVQPVAAFDLKRVSDRLCFPRPRDVHVQHAALSRHTSHIAPEMTSPPSSSLLLVFLPTRECRERKNFHHADHYVDIFPSSLLPLPLSLAMLTSA